MSESTLWALDGLMRALHAERLAEAARERLAEAAKPPKRPARVVVAGALRSLARLLDHEHAPAVRQPNRPYARA